MAGREWFEADELAGFWAFVRERQAVWYRRVVRRDDPPWTGDDVLRRHRFTNVYRRLDPGTQYVIREVLSAAEPAPDRVFNVLVYRLLGRSATHEHLGFLRLDDFDPAAFERSLRVREEAHDEPVFTGAYVVAPYAAMGGDDKIENVARLFGSVRDRFDGFYGELVGASEPQAAYGAIRGLPGFGDFLAYQVLVDLLYRPHRDGGTPLLDLPADEWAAAGPGARSGIEALLRDGADPGDLPAMRWLWDHQVEALSGLGDPFRWLRDPSGRRVELALPDVQNCLCEYYKYRKVRRGTGRTRRRFRPAERRSAAALRAQLEPAPVSIDPALYAAPGG